MRRVVIGTCAAGMLVCGGMAIAPAKAENYYGPAQANGQCFHKQVNWSRTGFGYWEECPSTAAASRTGAATRHH